jgi:uncharacterized delta-60 repeat protein
MKHTLTFLAALAALSGATRLHAQTPDAFNPGANATVFCLTPQLDGRILAGGDFTTLAGAVRYRLGRLTASGTLDTDFSLAGIGSFATLALQPDGRILVAGYFTSVAGVARTNFARLDTNGTVDISFDAGAGMNGSIYSLAVQADGKILVAGKFTSLAGQSCTNLGRLNADGTFDSSFNPGAEANEEVSALAIQPDGKVLAAGSFTRLGGQPRQKLGRLNNPDGPTQGLAFSGSTITWLRGGSSPEVWATTFESSTNGNDWASLGGGTRIAGGWQLSGLALAGNVSVRARGWVPGGGSKIYTWLVESFAGLPGLTTQPVSRTNNAGTTATFTVLGSGEAPWSCQWLKGGTHLTDGTTVWGAQTATLTLSNVLGGDAGRYSVLLSNRHGSVTSQVATLTVMDPFISAPPASQLVNASDPAVFSVAAAGTAPRYYQWRKDGTNLAGALAASLTLTNVLWEDRGSYDVVVSNSFGGVTSAVAVLSVNLALVDSFVAQPSGLYPYVKALAVLPDGKVIMGGSFSSLSNVLCRYLARLHADGSYDTNFDAAAGSDTTIPSVNSLFVQADGRILVGGDFRTMGGLSRTNIARLNADGSADTGFNAGTTFYVHCLAEQADGKIVVGGAFSTFNGVTRNRLARLNPDGSLDPGFNPDADGTVNALAVQPDGRILVGGSFTTLGGAAHRGLGRLNTNGTPDASFTANAIGTAAYVRTIAVQPDGRILLGGTFTNLTGQQRMYLGRLHASGSLPRAKPSRSITSATRSDGPPMTPA